jgi:hypothetical protein
MSLGRDSALLTKRHPIGPYVQHAIISGQGAEASTDFESWAKESYEIAAKIAYRNGGKIGSRKGGAMDCDGRSGAFASKVPRGVDQQADDDSFRSLSFMRSAPIASPSI